MAKRAPSDAFLTSASQVTPFASLVLFSFAVRDSSSLPSEGGEATPLRAVVASLRQGKLGFQRNSSWRSLRGRTVWSGLGRPCGPGGVV